MRASLLLVAVLALGACSPELDGAGGIAEAGSAAPRKCPAPPLPDPSVAGELAVSAAPAGLLAADGSLTPEPEAMTAADRSSEPAGGPDTATAAAALAAARENLLAGCFAAAESYALRALLFTPSDQRDAVTALLDRVIEIQRQEAQLDDATRLIADWEFDQARASLLELIKQVEDGRVLARARGLLAESHPTELQRGLLALRILWDWLRDLLPYLVVLVAVGAFFWLRRMRYRSRVNWWQLTEIHDTSPYQVGRLVVSYLSYWLKQQGAPITTGLLLLEASRIPVSPDFSLDNKTVDIAKELEADTTTVGPVTVGFLAKLYGLLRRLFDPGRQQIQGSVYVSNEKWLIARLTARYRDSTGGKPVDRYVTVSATADAASPYAAEEVAKEVTFKMLYAIANTEDLPSYEYANELRQGLGKLQSYVSGKQPDDETHPWQALRKARDIFAAVLKSSPDSLEAHLYEGMALDLLENHEQAIQHFRHVKELAARSGNEAMRQRAAYNEAVAELRNLYGQESIEGAILLIGKLIGPTVDLDKQLMALARAVQADAMAHRTLYLRKAVGEPQAVRGYIEGIRCQVLEITKTLEGKLEEKEKELKEKEKELKKKEKELKKKEREEKKKGRKEDREKEEEEEEESPDEKWDRQVLRQLEWAINNARADFFLYAAVSWDQYAVWESLGRSGDYLDVHSLRLLAKKFGPPERQTYYDEARVNLHNCEMLLPPGVETLSNLGTLFLFQPDSDLARSRAYLRRVLDLNPNYEYAYFRLAQTFEAEQRPEDVKSVLRKCPHSPRIREFREMYRHYYVQPRLDNVEDAKAADEAAETGNDKLAGDE